MNPNLTYRRGLRAFLALGVLFASGCGAAPADDSEAEPTGEASLAITSVPSGVLCIEAVATGSKTITKDFTVSAGASSVDLAVGRVSLGSVKFTASAFDAACPPASGATPTWVADP